MRIFDFSYGSVCVDFENGTVKDIQCGGVSLLHQSIPLFRLGLRMSDGESVVLGCEEASQCCLSENAALYSGFSYDLSVRVTVEQTDDALVWGGEVQNSSDVLIEWMEFPRLCLRDLAQNGGIGKVLYPYNEGALVDDLQLRQSSWFPGCEPGYPSKGAYTVFPNMLCSQFMCYLLDDYGFYTAAEDPTRGVKHLDFLPAQDGGVEWIQRLYSGVSYGENFVLSYPLVWRFFKGGWQQGAALYRRFFESHLPDGVTKIRDNANLPAWYADSPLVVAYPVRGVHDMDEMKPNRLYPYVNALPHLDQIAQKTGSRLLALLMHWEGTAPWAPPYVMPPFGGMEPFDAFCDALHERGHMLGVYCSGFGYTVQSNLIASYKKNPSDEMLAKTMCTDYDGTVRISDICTAQRKGYDICPASDSGEQILKEAYMPLFASNVDYVQILDQNHGGGQYFCHSKVHGHPSAPGSWMTESMQKLLYGWQENAPGKLFGCESAAAEPFIGGLLFSDNRYELNYRIGRPVPLYAFLYHEYVRNFMGNQVCAPFDDRIGKSLCMRLAYSFAAGDSMTLIMGQDGELLSAWGQRDFSSLPDKEEALTLIRNLTSFYQCEAKPFLHAGRMCVGETVACEESTFSLGDGRTIQLPSVFSSAWEMDGARVQMFVNHTDHAVVCRFADKEVCVEALSAVMYNLL